MAHSTNMDKTVKLRAYDEAAKSDVPQAKPAEDKSIALELAKKASLLEEEKIKSLELLKTIVQLRESLKQEKAKTAELDAKLTRLNALEESQLAKKNAQLEEEKKRSLEYMRTIEQLRESIKQDQARNAETEKKAAELEAKSKELAMLEAKVKDLSVVLNKISSIAVAGKLEDDK
jgi:hypothetical protein